VGAVTEMVKRLSKDYFRRSEFSFEEEIGLPKNYEMSLYQREELYSYDILSFRLISPLKRDLNPLARALKLSRYC
jgi:hypothetical protein